MRPDFDEYCLKIALVVGERATCRRHAVGAVAVKDKHILATGYNGAPSGLKDCLELGCLRDQLGIPSGKNHEICRAVHAEQNVIIQAALHGVSIKGSTLYCTHTPCVLCAKMLINAQIQRLVSFGKYNDNEFLTLFKEAGIQFEMKPRPSADDFISGLGRFLMELLLPGQPEPVKLETTRSALIVVDMQNGFCKKGGMIDLVKNLDEKRANRTIEVVGRVLQSCRKAGIKIFFLRMSYQPDLSNAGTPESPHYWKESAVVAMRTRPEFKGKFLTAGTWDREIADELHPHSGEEVIDKCRFSGFRHTDLKEKLRALKIKHLLFAGIATNVCVESSIRDAFFEDFFPVMISDACCTFGPDFLQQATVWNVTNLFGWVTTSEELAIAVSSSN